MATTNELLIRHLCADGKWRLFIKPAWLTDERMLSGEAFDVESFTLYQDLVDKDTLPAGVGTDCGLNVPPPAGSEPPAPTWDLVALNANKPAKIPGTDFLWSFKLSEVATAGAGATLSGIRIKTGPDYLSIVQQGELYRIYGSVPTRITFDEGIDLIVSETYTVGTLSTGKETLTTVSLPLGATDFYSNYQVNKSPNQAIVRIGPFGGEGNIPFVTFTAPDGTVIPRQQMQVFGIGAVDGYDYFYLATIPNPISGAWQVQEEFLGKTKYGTFVVTDQVKPYTGIALGTTPPVPPPAVTAKITAMDWYWQFTQRQANTVGATTIYTYLGNYYILLNVSNGGKPEFWANISLDGLTFPGFQKYALTALTNDAKGYTHLWYLNSAANVKTYFKVKIEGEDDSKFIFFDLTMPAPPAASTSRIQFYPASSGAANSSSGSGGSSGSSGTVSTGYGQTVIQTSNRQNFALAIQWSGGKARLVHLNPTPGIYLLAGQPEITSLPSTYDFYPGDEVEIFFIAGVSSSADFYNWPLSGKAQAIVRLGDAPTS